MVKVPGARLLIGRAAVRSESVGVEGPAWWVKHFKPVLNWWIWDPTHSSTLHPLYLTLCIPYCPHLPHSDPLSNGCHKTYSVPWLATLPEQNFQCLSVCMRVRECVLLSVCSSLSRLITWVVLRWDTKARQTRQPLACLPPAPLHDSSFSSRSLVLML